MTTSAHTPHRRIPHMPARIPKNLSPAPTRLVECFPGIRDTGRAGLWPLRRIHREFVGRRGRRTVRRLTKDIREFETRAGRVTGPYGGGVRNAPGIRDTGRCGHRPLRRIHREFGGRPGTAARTAMGGGFSWNLMVRRAGQVSGPYRNDVFEHHTIITVPARPCVGAVLWRVPG